MSTLSNSNVSFDGMRDLFDNLTSNGSTSAWSLKNQKHIDRCPLINGGQGSGKVPQVIGKTKLLVQLQCRLKILKVLK